MDVIAGVGVGVLLFLLYVWWRPVVSAWLLRRSRAGQLGLAFAASMALLATGVLMQLGVTDFRVPAAWIGVDAELIEVATGLSAIVGPAGALFGFAAGVLILARPAGFTAGGRLWQRVARYPVGIVGVVAFFVALGAAFPGGEDPLALALRYVRYALAAFWAGGVAPYLFVKLGLASPARSEGRVS